MGIFNKATKVALTLTLTSGKQFLNMGLLSSSIVMRKNEF